MRGSIFTLAVVFAASVAAAQTVRVNDPVVREGRNGTVDLIFTIHVDEPQVGGDVAIGYETANGTAQAGADYAAAAGTATIPGGWKHVNVHVVVNGDTVSEGIETLELHLTSASAGTIADPVGIGSIEEDPAGPPPVLPASWSIALSGPGQVNGFASTGSSIVAVSANGSIWTTVDGTSWAERTNPINQQVFLSAVAAGSGGLVAVGSRAADASPILLTSADAITWTQRAPAATRSLRGVAFAGGMFVAVGTQGQIVTSPDGISWTLRTSGTTLNLNAVAANGTTFVAVGSGGVIRTSVNAGITWTGTTAGSQSFNGVAWTGTRFVAVGNAGTIRTSADGSAWTVVPSPTVNSLFAVASGLGSVVAGGSTSPSDANSVFRSEDNGATWTPITLPSISGTSRAVRSLANVGGGYYCGATLGSVWASADGTTWTNRSPLPAGYLNDVAWSGSEFCAVGNAALRSVNGVQWASSTTPLLGFFPGILWDGARFVVVGNGGGQVRVYTSVDCNNWNDASPPPTATTATLQRVAFGGGMYVAGGGKLPASGGTVEEPYIISSPDLVTWTERPSGLPIGFRAYSMAYGAGRFAVSLADFSTTFSDALLTSQDGIAWTRQAWPFGGEGMNDMEFADGLFFTGGGSLRRSPNGIDWTMAYDAGPPYLATVAYGDGRWIAAAGADIAASPDGSRWTFHPPLPIRNNLIGGATYSPALRRFVIVAQGVVAYSTDRPDAIFKDGFEPGALPRFGSSAAILSRR